MIHAAPHGLVSGLTAEKAEALIAKLEAAGAEAEDEPLKTYNWPLPYDGLVNPLAINLTAFNTFVLICSSVTMVLALSAIQDGKRGRGNFFLAATVLIGSFFLSIQVYEYYQLMVGHHYPPGISATGHFRPSVSLFASCFFTMTGFHGAHVTGGVICCSAILIRSFFFNAYTQDSLCSARAGRPVLALRRPGLDHLVHDRLLDLKWPGPVVRSTERPGNALPEGPANG